MQKFEYKHLVYEPWDDYEEDNVKRFHDVVDARYGVQLCEVPLSPYEYLDFPTFKMWVDLGCPPREKVYGIDAIHKAYEEMMIEKILLGEVNGWY